MTPTVAPTMFILYVGDVAASAAFYAALLGVAPVEQTAGFALFAPAAGGRLGLWKSSAVVPAVAAPPGGSELCCPVADAATLLHLHRVWTAAGVRIAQAPETMDFGETFTALDPDGHRIRVFTPGVS